MWAGSRGSRPHFSAKRPGSLEKKKQSPRSWPLSPACAQAPPDAVKPRLLTTEFMRATRTPSSNILELSTASTFACELARTSMWESTRHSGCVDWYHANGPLYPVHLSGTRNPHVFGELARHCRPHRLNLWRPRPYIWTALTTSDVRLARAGWSVAILDVDEQNPDTASLSGGWLRTLDGEQTARCAELVALWWGLHHRLHTCSPRHGRLAQIYRSSQPTPTLVRADPPSDPESTRLAQCRRSSFAPRRRGAGGIGPTLLVDTEKRAGRRVGEPRSSQCRGPHCSRNWRCRTCRHAAVASPEKTGGNPFDCVSAGRRRPETL